MKDFMRALKANPKNPKNVKIPFTIFMAMSKFMEMLCPSSLTDDEKTIYQDVCEFMTDKKSRIVCRQAYEQLIQAKTPDEKNIAYMNYQAVKDFSI